MNISHQRAMERLGRREDCTGSMQITDEAVCENGKTQINQLQNINMRGTNYVGPECDTQGVIQGSRNRPFPCPICQRSFKHKDKLRRHTKHRVHKNVQSFKCRLCGKRNRFLKDHIAMCPVLSKIDTNMPTIMQEKRSRIFPCPICTCTFKFRYNLRRHIFSTAHKNIQASSTCKFCGKICERKMDLLQHVRKYFGPKENNSFQYKSCPGKKAFGLTCPICSRGFGNKRNLIRHIKTIHENIRGFACKICLKRGENVHEFLFHMESCTHALRGNSYDRIIEDNTVTPPFSCPICERSFKRSDNLRRHVKINHRDVGKFICRLCFKSGNTVDDFEQHVSLCARQIQSKDGKQNISSKINCAVKKTIRLFPCPICNCAFRFRYNLRTHLHGPIHKNTGHFTCRFCSQSGSGIHDIVSHMKCSDHRTKHDHCLSIKGKAPRIKKTNGQKNKNCEEKIDLLKKYSVPTGSPPKYTTYMDNKSVITTCPICAGEFGTKCSLIRHIKYIHGNIRRFSCKICLKHGENVNDFIFHMKRCLHALRRNSYDRIIEDIMVTHPFSCPVCERSFTRSDSLRRHVKINHKDSGKFICRLCFKSGNTVDELEQHVSRCSQRIRRKFSSRRSTSAKKNSSINRQMKYACFICDDLYPDRTKLVRHFRAHHGSLKTFTCNFCFHSGQNDPSSQALIEHLNLCHGYPRLEYKCHICHCIFTAKHKLNAHLKIKHHQSEDVSANRKLCCFLCDGFFPDANGLSEHMLDAHKDIRTLACKFCSYVGSIDSIHDFIQHVLRCKEPTVPDIAGKSLSANPPWSLTTDKPEDRVSRTFAHHY